MEQSILCFLFEYQVVEKTSTEGPSA